MTGTQVLDIRSNGFSLSPELRFTVCAVLRPNNVTKLDFKVESDNQSIDLASTLMKNFGPRFMNQDLTELAAFRAGVSLPPRSDRNGRAMSEASKAIEGVIGSWAIILLIHDPDKNLLRVCIRIGLGQKTFAYEIQDVPTGLIHPRQLAAAAE